MLTTEQLEAIFDTLAFAADGKIVAGVDETNRQCAAVIAEIRRRKHGPFTIAEAIASGRPFRRNSWAAWASEIIESPDGPEAITSDCSHVVWLRIGDIAAADYELMPEQEAK